ncbi:MAG: DUF120 domain-containing protein [Candidatus Thorarchaeota archaeon]
MTDQFLDNYFILKILITIEKLGASDYISISDIENSKSFNFSKDELISTINTLSPKYVEVKKRKSVLFVKLTKYGLDILRSLLVDLQSIFFGFPTQFQIRGLMITGLGEGKYYIAIPEYSKQFEELLGWVPFPGTLNIRLTTPDDVEGFQRLLSSPSYLIKGFQHEGRTFGEALLWKCEIQHFKDEVVAGAIIRPVRTHHSHQIIECIAPINLREKFNLKDEETIILRPMLT